MIISLYSPKTIDLTSGGADGRICLRIGDGNFANRVELWFKDQKMYDEFRNGLPDGVQPQKGSATV
jgi:hypothetical protein